MAASLSKRSGSKMSCRGRSHQGLPQQQGLPPHKPRCLYEILEIPKNASVQDIRTAYKNLAKKWHPDRCQANKAELAKEKFQLVSEAYAVLIDPGKREKYDRGELDHNKEPINVDEFLAELRTLMVMHGKTFPEGGIDASAIHNIPGTNIPDFNEIRAKIMAANPHHAQECDMRQAPGGNEGGEEAGCDQLGAFMADAVEVLGKNWYRCTLCTGPHMPVVVYPCQQMMRTHFEKEHICEFLAFLEEFFPEESGADPCEEFKKMLDCMNVSENDWKACQMIDQTAKQALPSHRPNGFTHGTHGPGRLQGNAQVPYSLSFTDLAGIEAQPAIPLMQRTFTMQRSMPNPPTDPLCPDWIGQALQEASGMPPQEPAMSSSSSSPSSSFYPSPGSGGGFPSGGGFAFGGVPAFGGAFANGGEMAHGARGNGRPPVSGGGVGASQGAGAKSAGSSCILGRKWMGKR